MSAAEGSPALFDLANQIREAGLDPDECYRVRDLDFTREDARIYLTEGFLIFGKKVNGRRFSAVFIGDIDGGDAEILLFPPLRSERMSLAKFTESPNLNEHFRFAAFLFTDDSYEEITRLIEEKFAGRKVPEAGPIYVEKHNSVVRNLSESLELRLVKDLSEGVDSTQGFFFGSIRGSRLGPFDFIQDALARKGIRIGQFTVRENTPFFDMWTEFEPRSVSSGKRQPAREEYTVEHYAIDATLEPDLLLKARTTLRVVPRVERQTIALLIAQNMQVTAARAGGEELEVYRPASTRLNTIRRDRDSAFLVRMPTGATVGQPMEIEIEHEGRVIDDSGNDVYFVGSRGSWYPGAGQRFATYDLNFRIPAELNFVCTGPHIEAKVDNGYAVYQSTIAKPVRTFGFNLGKYKQTTADVDGFTVNVYANRQVESALMPRDRVIVVPSTSPSLSPRRGALTPTVTTLPAPVPDPTDRLGQLAREVGGVLAAYKQMFGDPPLQTLNVSPIPGHFGQGFAGMIYLSTLSYLPESQRPAYARDPYSKTFYSDLLLAHEVAHQWWGNLVYSESDQDEWIMEGLANYSSLLMLEKQKGPKALVEVLQKYRDNLLTPLEDGRTVEQAGPVVWGERLINSRDRGAWAVITYEKGTWIFHMLRARMGDEAFLRMLRELPRQFEHKALSTAMFREFAASFMPKGAEDASLEEFFAQWVESTGVPKVELVSSVTGKAPKVTVDVTVKQSEVPDEFGALVPVVIRFGKDREETRWVRATNDGEQQQWTFRSAPARVELDPAHQTLRRE